ncbi:tyrosine-type recombinase/integrase [Euzebya sp.]|uniref:tyrosine-type recombinase/integrase n=1 Tax=Euzebya sp. TaxID=1971409 RepID=UPI003515757F
MGFIDKQVRTGDGGATTVRWRARYRDPAGRERSKTFKRKLDAERHLVSVEARMLQGEWTDPERGRTTVAEWAPKWLDSKRALKPKTRYTYESLLRKVTAHLGGYPLAKLDRLAVETFVSQLEAEGLSASRVRQCHMMLGAMLDAAVASRILTHNVARGVELPRLRPARRRFLDQDQVRRLADAVGPDVRPLILTLAYGGLRWGEALAVRRRGCDLDRRRLHITESVVEIGSRQVWGPPKTHRVRSVQLPAFVCDELQAVLADLDDDAETLIFTTPYGATWSATDFRDRVWKPALAAAGLDDTLTVHELRHTAASLLIAAGAGPKSIQAQLGHSTITTTFDVYGHLFDGHLDTVMDDLDRAWRCTPETGRDDADAYRMRTAGALDPSPAPVSDRDGRTKSAR